MKKSIKKAIKETDKKILIVYFILRILVILCMIREIFNGNIENALLCIFSLILFLVPSFIERTFKIELPTTLEIIILIFIFSAEILGEIGNFYGKFAMFDDILHTINGFLCASVGFSLVYLLNENVDSFKLSPLFVSLVAFCFSMTIGVAWEFFEYTADNVLGFDMQKDQYVTELRTVTLDPKQDNTVIKIENIDKTVIYDKNDVELAVLDGYLDIGLHDTMEDLLVNFVGAFTFSIFGYLYIINHEKYKLAEQFLTKKMV